MRMDIYELEVKNLLENGGNERLKSQFMNLSRRLDEVSNENRELKKQISELESELSKKEILLKMREEFCEECKEKSAIEKLKETPLIEEPLPFSSDEYEEDRIDKIEKVVLGIQGFLKKETEQKIKELEEEQERLMREMAHQRFISNLVRPLKP